MKTIFRLAKTELRILFCSPVSWLILVIFAFQAGLNFSENFGGQLKRLALEYGLGEVTMQTFAGYTGLLVSMVNNLYLYIPLITMGLMSRELSSGSIKFLYSSPITTTQIILGKYLSMLIYGFILMMILLIYVFFGYFTIENMDLPYVLTGVLGLYLLTCAYAAIGLFMSSITSYQVVAAMGTLAILAVLNFIGDVGQSISFVRDITYWLSISGRTYPFLSGMICSEDILYFNSGNSGGCRPKCLWHDREGAWLVKFRHTYDPKDIGRMEYKYNEVARKCGINVPDYKLLDGKYFASKRFDIENGKRLHIATAGALLNESISNPKLDYKVLLHLTGYLTQDSQQVDEMFQRMVFNVLTDNKDDHVKNFSFICREGKWSLAPAYDLTLCKEGYHGEHATSANNKGNPDIEDMLAVGESIRIPRRKGMEIINHMINHCQEILSTRFE